MRRGQEEERDIRLRIVRAAGQAFADEGYRRMTVRTICRAAGVNVAAVNYYFHSKENLYLEVFKYWKSYAFRRYPLLSDLGGNASPEAQLRAFVEGFLMRIVNRGEVSVFGRLMARELAEPTAGLDLMVEETIRPAFSILSSIVRRVMGKRVPEAQIRFCCASIVGQCFFYYNARPVMKRLFSREELNPDDAAAIVDHIVRYSLCAMRGLAAEGRWS